jgi:endonuclease/exonuclease/phosphatase family metal-dependent hydrolase
MSVVTLNTCNGNGLYGQRKKALIEGLAVVDPDIVFLQDVFAAQSIKENMALACASGLGRHYVYHPARVKERTVDGVAVVGTSGLCILTRWSTMAPRAIRLPTTSDDGERLAQLAYVECNGSQIALVNVHLTDLPDRDDLRIDQLRIVLDTLASGRQFDIAILAGDFNSTPTGPVVSWLKSEAGLPVTDAYAGLGQPFATFAATRDGKDVSACVDYIFALKTERSISLSFVEVDRILGQQASPNRPGVGDHFGVLAQVRTEQSETEHS